MVTSLMGLKPIPIRSINMGDNYVEIFGIGILAISLCIVLLFTRKRFSSKIIWRSLFLFCITISLAYSINIRKGCGYNRPKFIKGICFDIKLFPNSTVPPIFER